MIYVVIYDCSKGLTVITVDMMFHQAIQLSGWHWNKLLFIPVNIGNNMPVYQMTKLAIQKCEHHSDIIEFIQSIHTIFNDTIGQTPEIFYNTIEIFSMLFAV